jgi:hypothetical protein
MAKGRCGARVEDRRLAPALASTSLRSVRVTRARSSTHVTAQRECFLQPTTLGVGESQGGAPRRREPCSSLDALLR